jgi:hypothetical protein
LESAVEEISWGLERNFVFREQLYDEILIKFGGLHENLGGWNLGAD